MRVKLYYYFSRPYEVNSSLNEKEPPKIEAVAPSMLRSRNKMGLRKRCNGWVAPLG